MICRVRYFSDKVIKIWRTITVYIFILLQSHEVVCVYFWKNELRFCFCGSATRRNSILFIFVLILQFIAIRVKKTYIICKKDRHGHFGEPPISDRTYEDYYGGVISTSQLKGNSFLLKLMKLLSLDDWVSSLRLIWSCVICYVFVCHAVFCFLFLGNFWLLDYASSSVYLL